jgi:hypothetical protein
MGPPRYLSVASVPYHRTVSTRDRDQPDATARWDAVYAEGAAPWDIGRPQPAFVRQADANGGAR